MPVLVEKPNKKDFEITLSHSKIKVFSSCKKQYKYSYIEKIPKKEFEHLIFGKFLHAVLEEFHLELIKGDKTPLNQLMARCFKKSYEVWKKKLQAEPFQEAKTILTGYLNKIKDNVPNVLSVEKEFYVDIDGKVLINGFIDKVQLDTDGMLHISDYKTTALKSIKYLAKDFSQLKLYAFIEFLRNPELEKIRTSYTLLRKNFDIIEKEFLRPEAMEIENYFLQVAEEIKAEKLYRPNPTSLCKSCSYLDICKEGQELVQKLFHPEANSKFGETKW